MIRLLAKIDLIVPNSTNFERNLREQNFIIYTFYKNVEITNFEKARYLPRNSENNRRYLDQRLYRVILS